MGQRTGRGGGAAGEGGATLSRTAARGVAWLLLQSVGGRLAALLSQLVLAWILTPNDFGTVGLVLATTTIASTLVNFGVDDVFLQRQHAFRAWATPTFWTSLALGTIGLVAAGVISAVSAHLFRRPEIVWLAVIFATSLPVVALQTVPLVRIKSALDFRFLSLCTMSELIGVQALSIVLALAGFGAYSFVIPVPVCAAVKLVVFWRHAPVRIGRRMRLVQIRFLLGSGSAVFGTRLLITAMSQGDYLILGLFAPTDQVGLYYFAFRLAAQPVWMLAGNFSNVLFPTLVRLRGEPQRQTAAAITTARIIAYAVMPACLLQAVLARPILEVLFQAKWTGAAPIMQVLSIGLALDAVTWVTGTMLNANRQFGRALLYTGAFVPLFALLVALGAWLHGAVGTAVGVTSFYAVLGFVMPYLVLHHHGLGVRQVLVLVGKPLAIAAVSAGGAVALLAPFPLQGHDLVWAVLAGAGTVLLDMLLVDWLEPTIIPEILGRGLPGRFRAAWESARGRRVRVLNRLMRQPSR